jgi:hypothetical protein
LTDVHCRLVIERSMVCRVPWAVERERRCVFVCLCVEKVSAVSEAGRLGGFCF